MDSNELVVITGASSGIGRASAVRFARAGFRVVGIARSRDRLEALADEVREDPRAKGDVEIEAVDAADGRAVIAMAEGVLARHGAPGVIVNSAGAGQWLDVEDTTPERLHEMMGAPFYAAFHMCHAFVGPMRARARGVIIHVGSPASHQPWPGSTGYACARWALRGLHEALRVDLAGSGLHSCHVLFGEVTSAYFDNNPASYERIPAIGKLIPKMSPEDCADVIFELAHKPRPESFHPVMLRAFFVTQSVAESALRTLVARTGRKR